MNEDPGRERAAGAGSEERGLRVVSPEPRTNDDLPLALTSFVGREAELDEARGIVRRERLVTLIGVGGCGKTRLALEAARTLAEEITEGPTESSEVGFPDGVWLVELAPLRDPALVAREVAAVLGIGERPGSESLQDLAAALRDARCLILLDNCEHVVGACAVLAEGLLRQCPGLAVFATSREPLGAAGERVWPVPPLSVPDSSALETAARSESVRLFVERASAALPAFGLTEKNAPAVAEVCRRLDGIPLAIELAAARVRSMTAAQISVRLDDALGLLTSSPRTAPGRQSTLRATLDWSHDLLSPAEKVFFRNLSVFNGGFTLEAAEEVCATESLYRVGGESAPALDLLTQLVDKSLVRVQRTGEEARYRLLEVVRQYTSEKLEEAGEAEALRRRHAVFFRDFAEEAEPQFHGPDREFWLDLVEEDLDNFRAAMSWTADSGEAELNLRLSNALRWFWLRRGRLAEGRASLERALKAGTGSKFEVAKAINVFGALAWAQGDRVAARSRLGEAVECFRELGEDAWLSSALYTYGFELLAHGEIREALTAATESVAVGRRAGEDPNLARALAALGMACMAAGDFAGAISPLEESAAICRRLEDGWLLSLPLMLLGVMAFRAGDHERAQSLVEESVRALRGLGEHFLLSNSLSYLAVILATLSHARRAAILFGASEAMREAVGQEEVLSQYRADYNRGVVSARDALGEEEFAAAWSKGREMYAEVAISYALEEDEKETGEQPVPILSVHALGQTRVEVGDRVVESSDWTYAKVAELFFYLISHPPATREKIGLDLWPDASPSRLRNALHSAMHRLRKTLGPPNRIHYKNGRYAFDHTLPYGFDVADFEEKTRRARKCAGEDPDSAATFLEEAARLYRGDFLEGFAGEEWIFTHQQELRESYIEGQLLLGRLYTEQGEDLESTRAYRRIIARDPYSGGAHAGLIRSYSRLGRQGRAFGHYQDLVDTFQRDLGAKPPPEVTVLIERLRRGEGL